MFRSLMFFVYVLCSVKLTLQYNGGIKYVYTTLLQYPYVNK